MEVRNCPECGRLFNYIRTNICPVCVKEREEEFQKVRIYLREHPNISILELSEETGVDEEKIIQWIRDGRIESKSLKGSTLKCSSCGIPISSGSQCEKCKNNLADEFSKASQEMQSGIENQKKSTGFHTRRK